MNRGPDCLVCNGSGIAYDWYDGKMEGWCYEPCAACSGKGVRLGDMYQAAEPPVLPITLRPVETVSIACVALLIAAGAATFMVHS